MSEQLALVEPSMHRWAVLSPDGAYRYELGRRWGTPWAKGGRRLLWVMLNPSIADAVIDDQTVRQCITYSKREGFDELLIVNLFAYRATDPRTLGQVDDPVGPDNMTTLSRHLLAPEQVVAAWGAHPMATAIADDVLGGHRPLYCLGTTKDGHPRHPSRLGHDVPLEVWRS